MTEQNLTQDICNALGATGSKILPRIVDMIADDKERRILLAAFPAATIAELSEKTGMPRREVHALIKVMFRKGLVFKSKQEGDPRFYRVRSVPQFHDSSILWKEATKEFLNLWKEYMEKEFREYGKVMEAVLPRPPIRVVPVGATVESKAKILAFEDVREIVNKARKLAVTPCTCRVIDGKCGKPVEICIQVNRAAEYSLERGTGRELTKEEAVQLLHLAEKEGLVHVVDNRQTVDHIICNCCRDCCLNWRLPNPHKFVAPSRFRAAVNEEECIGCQACLERCYFDAISFEGADAKASINEEKCVGCGVCSVICPVEALSLKQVLPPESVPVS
jgi:Fe-S-cluster-containing hydrogenase component 2